MRNAPGTDWPAWYAEHRVLPYVRGAVDRGTLRPGEAAAFERVCARLPELAGPAEPPARLHGDLWHGNVLRGADGGVRLIDPAAHGGHRETDLAVLRLFGCPHLDRIIAGYHEAAPLADGRLARVGVHPFTGAVRHAALHRRTLGEPPGRGPPRPPQALATASGAVQRSGGADHADHHVPAGRAGVRGALPGSGGQAGLRRPSAGAATGRADQPGRPGRRLRGCRLRPTLLQRRIAKRADIRLTAVGDRLLAARKPVPADADPDDVDVRFAPSASPWLPVDVPPRLAMGVLHYLRDAELASGAFDFAEDVDGIRWFLECNQSGQFGFVEMDTGQPIAGTIARWLAGDSGQGRPYADGAQGAEC